MTDIPTPSSFPVKALGSGYQSETALRRKVFAGFSVVTLLVGLLFILEGYDASLQFGRQMEFTQLHSNTEHTAEYLHTVLEDYRATKGSYNAADFRSYLDTLNYSFHLHLSGPSAVFVDLGDLQSASLSSIELDQANRFIQEVNRRLPEIKVGVTDSGHLLQTYLTDMDQFIFEWDGGEFGLMVLPYDDIGTITTIQKLNTLGIAQETVLPRMIISSLVVLWIGFWASFGMALFVSKRVTKSNNVLLYAANYDTCTNLPNQNYLAAALDDLAKQTRHTEPNTALIFISVNNIQVFEHTYGSAVKEMILKSFSQQLERYSSENALVGRYEGNLFYVLASNKYMAEIQQLAHQITQQFHEPIVVGPAAFLPALSLGIAPLSQDIRSNDELCAHAALAVRFAKDHRQTIKLYGNELTSLSEQKIRRSAELSRALSQDEFILLYQPKVDLETGAVVGFEALVRWDHPDEGRLGPGEFLDLIETSCISRQFTPYVINKALQQLREWRDAGFQVPIAVNISPYDLQDDYLVTFLERTLDSGSLADYLEIELTETATTVEVKHTVRVFEQLKRLGIKRSIDDFGTGMSSLSYLNQIPFDTVKIDMTFIRNLLSDTTSQVIVKSVLQMGQNQGWSVVAEGIEDVEVAAMLHAMGCQIGQGYYFAKPMTPVDAFNFANNTEYC